MDPLTALSLASNVIQFVDFSTRLVSKGYKIYKSADGTLAENVDAEAVTNSLNMLNGKLQRSVKDSKRSGPLSEDDQSLMILCANCESVADELLARFDRVKVTGKYRKWKSARQALKSVSNKDDLELLLSRLGMYRSEITLHITVSLRERIDLLSLQQSQRFNDLDSSTKDIMETILDTRKDIINAVIPKQPTGLHLETGHGLSAEEGNNGLREELPGLHEAAAAGDRSRLRSLLSQQGADVNAKDENGQTALHIAATGDHSLLVQTLLNNHARLEAEDNSGRTALHCAAAFGKWAVLRILLTNGANQNAEDDDQRTPVYYAEDTIQTISHEICVWIFKHGHDIKARDDHQDTLLLVAAYNGFKSLVYHLLDKRADIEVTGGAGITPLIAAAAQGNASVVRLLLDRGARIEATDPNGTTALIRAAWRGHTEAVGALLDHEANIEAKNSEEFTALYVAGIYNHPKTVQSLLKAGARANGHHLYRASERGRAEVADLLVKAGGEIEYKAVDGTTSLMIAAFRNKAATIQVLLENGANIESRRQDGATALWIASESGHEQVVQILLNNGADIESKGTDLAHTSLTKASQQGHFPMVKLLLDRGADIESTNKDGSTALMEAVWNNKTKIADLLIFRGANIESHDLTQGGCTPLIRASLHGHREMVELLLDRGADLEAKSLDAGHSALATACCFKRSIVSLLLHKGADVETRDRVGRTPIMHTAVSGNKGIVDWLLRYGAFRGAKDTAGSTAISLAAKEGHDEIVRLLR